MDIELDYPDDVRTIARYLFDNDISMSKEEIQDKYREFSDTYAANWMTVREHTLDEFYSWLKSNYIDNAEIEFPDSVYSISCYLYNKDIVMSDKEIQDKYREFSEEKYSSTWEFASDMDGTDKLLDEFYAYLKNKEKSELDFE